MIKSSLVFLIFKSMKGSWDWRFKGCYLKALQSKMQTSVHLVPNTSACITSARLQHVSMVRFVLGKIHIQQNVQILSVPFSLNEFWQIHTQSPIKITPIPENSLVPPSSQSPLQPPSEAKYWCDFFFTLVSPILELHVNEITSTVQRKVYFIEHSVHRVFAHTSNDLFYCWMQIVSTTTSLKNIRVAEDK